MRKPSKYEEKRTKPEYAPPLLEPKTDRQREYLKALRHSDQTIVVGPPGTGKTYLASAVAVDKLRNGAIDRIILTRPTVAVSNEQLGYFPGDINQKLGNWMMPFVDVMSQRLGPSMFRDYVMKERIQTIPLATMRGRSFDNVFLILDEGQNCDLAQLRMVLTRLGEGSQIVINGDITQSDLKEESGLSVLLKIIRAYNLPVKLIEFTRDDVVRSGICRIWTDAFESWESGR